MSRLFDEVMRAAKAGCRVEFERQEETRATKIRVSRPIKGNERYADVLMVADGVAYDMGPSVDTEIAAMLKRAVGRVAVEASVAAGMSDVVDRQLTAGQREEAKTLGSIVAFGAAEVGDVSDLSH